MGKFFKEIALIILVLFSSRITFSQINDITRLPGQDPHQSITRSASVMLSENDIMVFFANEKFDTIFVTQSNDGGLNWSESEILKTIDHPDNQRYFDLIANKSSTGRILVAWSVKWIGINIIYSDDNGVSWSQPQVIVGLGDDKFNCTYLNFSNYPDGKIAISFNQYRFSSFINSTNYLKTSSDNGTTWSENINTFPQNGANLCIYSFDNQNMIAALQIESSGNSGIFMMKSSDGGNSWSDTSAIVNTTLNETNPKLIALDNGNLFLTFQREYHTKINNFYQNDIIYITSMDQGTSWNNEVRFTKYIGNDISPYLSSFNNKTFISFSTQRFDNIYQLAFGIIGETIEKFTPPFIYQTNISNVYNHDTLNQTFNYEAVIIDDDSVAVVSLEYADSTLSGELYDDGMHSDGEAGDNIFGNAFPFPPYTVKDVYEINTSKFKLPIKNNGVIADARLNQQIIFKTQAEDIQNNKSVKVDTQNVVYSNSVGKFEDGSFLYSAGFFLSGLTNGKHGQTE